MIHYSCIGATGYVCGEVLRMMVNHHEGELVNVLDTYGVGDAISTHHPALRGFYDQVIMDLTEENVRETAKKSDVIMIQVPSGDVAKWAEIVLAEDCAIIDIGADIRFRDVDVWEKWYGQKHPDAKMTHDAVYCIPEVMRDLAKGKKLIANPGCYPSSAILGLYAAFKHGLISPDNIVIDSKSGTSGAGRKPVVPSLFCEVYDTFRAYGLGKHRHTPEIEQEFSRAAGCDVRVSFNPHLVPMVRGILSTIYTTLRKPGTTLDEVHAAYCETWAQSPWVRVLPKGKLPETRFVRGSMFCDLGLVVDPRTNRLIVVSAIDNLCRGASGQALANANLMCGLPVDCGLNAAPMLP